MNKPLSERITPVSDNLIEQLQAYREANRIARTELATVKAQRDALLAACKAVARSACLQQFNGDKCICFACEARQAIASAEKDGAL